MDAVPRTRCAGLVLVLSLMLVTDGVTRINLFAGTPSGTWSGNDHVYPPVLELIAAVLLTCYGLLGMTNSFYALVIGKGSALVTLVILAVEFAFGWFFFSVFVLAMYPFMVARSVTPIAGNGSTLTSRQAHSLIMMNYLAAIGTGVPVLAGHFYVTLQLCRFQANKAEIYTPAYARARVYFYAALVVIRGVGEIAAGGIVHATLTTGRLAMSLPTIPVIMTFPSIAIADGVLVLVTGLLALVIGIVGLRSMVLPFCALSAFAYTVQLALFAITQIGINATNPLALGSIICVETFAMFALPAYLLAEWSNEGASAELHSVPKSSHTLDASQPLDNANKA